MKNQLISLNITGIMFPLDKKSEYRFLLTDLITDLSHNTLKIRFQGIMLGDSIKELELPISGSCPVGCFDIDDIVFFKYEKYGSKNFWIGRFMAEEKKDTYIFLGRAPEFTDIWEMKRNENEAQD